MFLAGGVESMSRAPFVMGKAEAPFGRDMRMFDSTIGARFPNPKVEGRYGGDTMPETADNLARDYQITREEADTFAAGSQKKYAAAKADGFFAGEIIAGRGAGRPRRAGDGRRKTSTRGRRPTWRRSPNCGRCSRTASPPPATPRASTTARWR